MIRTSIDKFAESIGFDIANGDDKSQSDLLNGFCKGLNNSMNEHDLNTQICYIANKLNKTTAKVLKSIVEYTELKDS